MEEKCWGINEAPVKRCDGRNVSCLPAAAFADAGGRVSIMHTPGTALVRVFLRTE